MQPAAWVPRFALALAVLTLPGCPRSTPLGIRPPPVVRQQVFASPQPFLSKVAVAPFHPIELSGVPDTSGLPRGGPGAESASVIGGYVTEALKSHGVATVPASDLALAFEGKGLVVPRQDARSLAEVAHRDFGATAVLLGRVIRFRERVGSAAGAKFPASVAFEVSVHEAPSGRRLWNARFDETQMAPTESIFRAAEYPGGGTRWLTANEFARWGANRVVEAMLAVPAPSAPGEGERR